MKSYPDETLGENDTMQEQNFIIISYGCTHEQT